MSDRVKAALPANNSGAMYICVPVWEEEEATIVFVKPALVSPARYSSDSTCPIPKSLSLTPTGGAGGLAKPDCFDAVEITPKPDGVSPHRLIKILPGFTSR